MATTSDEVAAAVSGQTVASAFVDTVRRRPEAVALRRTGGDDAAEEWTWSEYAERATRVAGGLAGIGLARGERVVLMLRNRPEFHAADMGVLLAGGTPISIYNSSSPEQVQYLTDHSEAAVAIVEDVGFLERFLKVQSE